MRHNPYMLFLLFITIGIYGQNLIPEGHIGNFSSASTFSINPAGFIYVADGGKNEILKLDTLGNTLKMIGGYGWSEGSFDNPVDIYTNVLNVYVADKNNNRIQYLDKDLNYISQLSIDNLTNEQFGFRYPTGVGISKQGDLFVLDSDNRRILKFGLNGEFITTIGSIDSGPMQLNNPIKFCLDETNNILVLENKSIILFDQFGNGLKKIQLPDEFNNISFYHDKVILTNRNGILISAINEINRNSTTLQIQLEEDEEIVDAAIFNSRLYILTKTEIRIFNIIKQMN